MMSLERFIVRSPGWRTIHSARGLTATKSAEASIVTTVGVPYRVCTYLAGASCPS